METCIERNVLEPICSAVADGPWNAFGGRDAEQGSLIIEISTTYFDIMACVALLNKSKPPAPPAECVAAAVSAGPDIVPCF